MGESSVNLDTFLFFNLRMVIAGIIIFFVYSNLKNQSSGYYIVAGLIFLYLFTFISGRYYLREGFRTAETTQSDVKPLSPKEVVQDDVVLDETTRAFYDKPIDSVDDYEYNMVFENDRELTKELRSKLMSQYPMDWTTNPPSSSNFNKGMQNYLENETDVSGAQETSVFNNIGQLVKTENVYQDLFYTGYRIALSSLPTGIYLMQINSSKVNEVFKIVKNE